MKSIVLVSIICIITNLAINSANASENCDITISPKIIDYGNITPASLYNEAEKNNESFTLTQVATLEVSCAKRRIINVTLSSPQSNSKYFNAGHNAKVSIIADNIETDADTGTDSIGIEHVTFINQKKEYKLNARINKEWQPGYTLESNARITKLIVQMKIKLSIPHSMLTNSAPLNFNTMLNFLTFSKSGVTKEEFDLKKYNECTDSYIVRHPACKPGVFCPGIWIEELDDECDD
ncbi:MAG: hypothetical protein ACEY29_00175 [Arsenophonus sp.]